MSTSPTITRTAMEIAATIIGLPDEQIRSVINILDDIPIEGDEQLTADVRELLILAVGD